jgi:hypothetical protein
MAHISNVRYSSSLNAVKFKMALSPEKARGLRAGSTCVPSKIYCRGFRGYAAYQIRVLLCWCAKNPRINTAMIMLLISLVSLKGTDAKLHFIFYCYN